MGQTYDCRYCHKVIEKNEKAEGFQPCHCTSTIHQKCLADWIQASQRKSCEICQYKFQFTTVAKSKFTPKKTGSFLLKGLLMMLPLLTAALLISPQSFNNTFEDKYKYLRASSSFLLFVGSDLDKIVDIFYCMVLLLFLVLMILLGYGIILIDKVNDSYAYKCLYLCWAACFPVLQLLGNLHYYLYYSADVIPVFQFQMTWRTFLVGPAGLVLIIAPVLVLIGLVISIYFAGKYLWLGLKKFWSFCCLTETTEMVIANVGEPVTPKINNKKVVSKSNERVKYSDINVFKISDTPDCMV